MNERFGPGTASYVEVRDEFAMAEMDAWFAWFESRDAYDAAQAEQKEHDDVMTAAAAALR